MTKKEYRIDKCLRLGEKFILEDKVCLIGFDVKGFTKMPYPKNCLDLEKMVKELNEKFSNYLPEGNYNDPREISKGFQIYRGDSAIAQINSVEGIKEIILYQKNTYKEMPLHWRIAKDKHYHDLF